MNSPGAKSALAVFTRSPQAGKVKTRLASLLGPLGAAQFHAALVADTLQKLGGQDREVSNYLFLAGKNFPVNSSASACTLVTQRGRGLGERLDHAFRYLLARHARGVIIGTDSPELPPRFLRQAFDELRVCDSVLGPCPDGGFYLIGLRQFARGIFSGIRWSSAHAFRDTERNLLNWGFSCSVLEPCADIDRPSDVKRLIRELKSSPAARRLAPHVWRFLKDFYALAQ